MVVTCNKIYIKFYSVPFLVHSTIKVNEVKDHYRPKNENFWHKRFGIFLYLLVIGRLVDVIQRISCKVYVGIAKDYKPTVSGDKGKGH